MMISKFHRTLTLIWLALVVSAFSLSFYLSRHPEMVLGIEQNKPGHLMLEGRRYVQAGNLPHALNAFSRARSQFAELYAETGLERHKSYLAQSIYSLANAYHVLGVTPEWQKALPLYQEALDLYPDGNHGIWHLSKGMVHEQLQQYDPAILHFSRTLQLGTGLTQTYTLYERGRSYLMLGNVEKACDDLHTYLRSLGGLDALSEEQWLEFAPLQHASNPKKHYILALMYRFLDHPSLALQHIRAYLQIHPNDRAALYELSALLQQPFVQDQGEIPPADLIPPQPDPPYLLTDALLHLFMASPGTYSLHLRLSLPGQNPSATNPKEESEDLQFPKLTVECNGEAVSVFFVSRTEPQRHTVTIELMEGKNRLILKTQPASLLEPLQQIHVHGIELSPAAR